MKNKLWIAFTTIFFLSACGRLNNKETDGKKDLRIVCLSKHLTEMLFALGKGLDIVAYDLSSLVQNIKVNLKSV